MSGELRSPPVDDRLIWDCWLSMHHLPAMLAANEIGLFDALAEGSLPIDELAARCGVNARSLGIVNGLLCALGLLARRDGRYGLTLTSRHYLVKSSEFYWGSLLSGSRADAPLTEKILAALALAPGASLGAENATSWEAGEVPIEQARRISAFMHAHSRAPAIGVARHPVFRDVKRFLDVGAGSGVFAITVAQQWPHLRSTILDLDGMCTVAQDYVAEAGVTDRVDLLPLDFFRDPFPQGYDALFFSNVFHDWSDQTCLKLARKAFDVLPSGGRIMLHEQLMDDGLDGPATTASFSLLMLSRTPGRQYSLPEFSRLLGEAGFVNCEATATCGYYSLVIAQKP